MSYIDLVNIKQGSKSVSRFSNGNTLPLVQRPFGFAAFVPQTDSTGNPGWFYHPDAKSFEGIRLTHQPSPWIGDRASIAFMPQRGVPCTDPGRRWSGIRSEKTVLQPHYMSYYLTRTRAAMELTPTESGACVRVTYKNSGENWFSVFGTSEKCGFTYENGLLTGHTESHTQHTHFKMYFAFAFPEGCVEECRIDGDAAAHLKVANKQLVVKVSSSFISKEQAVCSLNREHTYEDFDALKETNRQIWEEKLSSVQIETKDEAMKRTFYSCLYRAFLFPHRAHEIDAAGQIVHFQPETGTVEPGMRYTDNGFWDTYRTVYSFLPLVDWKEYQQMIESFVREYQECGWLPRWMALEAVNCMPSTAIDVVLADAAHKGALKGEMLEKALEGMLKHATQDSPVPVYGREGCSAYLKYGYVPCDLYHESVNLTLDAAYGDFCIAEIASMLGKEELAAEYYKRSKRYENLFDKETGFMRPRKTDGSFTDDFLPEYWGRYYTESSAWVASTAVQHDFDGLAKLHGGTEQFLEYLDRLFAADPDYEVTGYGCEIHEMTEFAVADWGQCAISNQPSFHIPFLYSYFGQEEKSTKWLETICREGFSAEDDGFPGDEDNGTMACWYLFAVMGFYPLRAGINKFVKTGMLADDVKILGKSVGELVEFEKSHLI